ncbi:MAG: hypothetical protein HY360_21700 [Verrucomicrobia bacterium]|nr:hypothetical protein [Verrucomicrobiota bacterium]
MKPVKKRAAKSEPCHPAPAKTGEVHAIEDSSLSPTAETLRSAQGDTQRETLASLLPLSPDHNAERLAALKRLFPDLFSNEGSSMSMS